MGQVKDGHDFLELFTQWSLGVKLTEGGGKTKSLPRCSTVCRVGGEGDMAPVAEPSVPSKHAGTTWYRSLA